MFFWPSAIAFSRVAQTRFVGLRFLAWKNESAAADLKSMSALRQLSFFMLNADR